jgi:tetratricopeptide (TPR) repeat protein
MRDIGALIDACEEAHRREDMRGLEELAEELLRACEASGDPRRASGYVYLSIARAAQNDADGARNYATAALRMFSTAGDRVGILRAKVALAFIAGEVEIDRERARELAREALDIARDIGDPERLAVCLGNYAEVCRQDGSFGTAIGLASESAELYERNGRFARAAAQHGVIAQIYVVQRKFETAIEHLRIAWALLRRERIPRHFAWYFEVWITIAVALDKFETAARLYGFIDLYRDRHGVQRQQGVLSRISGPVERIFSVLGEQRAHALVEEGEALSVDAAQALTNGIRIWDR